MIRLNHSFKKIEAEKKAIEEDQDYAARGYAKEEAGKIAFEKAKAHQVRLLQEYEENIKKRT